MIAEMVRAQLNRLPLEARFQAIGDMAIGLATVMLDISGMPEDECNEIVGRINLAAKEKYCSTVSRPILVVPINEVLRAAAEIKAMMVLCSGVAEEDSTEGMFG